MAARGLEPSCPREGPGLVVAMVGAVPAPQALSPPLVLREMARSPEERGQRIMHVFALPATNMSIFTYKALLWLLEKRQ